MDLQWDCLRVTHSMEVMWVVSRDKMLEQLLVKYLEVMMAMLLGP